MNKVQETLAKMVFQYIKETYPEDKILNHLMKGYEELDDKNKEPEKPTRISYASPLSETLLEEKDRIKQIMDIVMDPHYKPSTPFPGYKPKTEDENAIEPVVEEVVAPEEVVPNEPVQTDE